jgi:ADP-ribose pyrophosphatase YjhB (NUDIX family)
MNTTMASSSLILGRSLRRQLGITRQTTYHGHLFSTYAEKKQAEKQKRTERYNQKVARLERLKTRRDGKPLDLLKNKFREWFDKKRIYQEIQDRKARQENMEWDIQVAAIVERLPVVTPDKPQWEQDYIDLRTYLDQFGKEYPPELGMPESDDFAMTEEDLLAALPEGFTPAPRITPADESGDVKTLDRRLSTRVYFTILEDSDESKWEFPTVAVGNNETLLDAAKRAVQDAAGSKLELWCPSNCPVAVDLRVYPDEEQQSRGKFGSKTFFMKVQYDEGPVVTTKVKDYAWLERSELTERVKQERGEHASKFYHYLL